MKDSYYFAAAVTTLLSLLRFSTSAGVVLNTDRDRNFLSPTFEFTGIQRDLTWETKLLPVPLNFEARLLESGVLIRRGEFGRLSSDRVDEIRAACARHSIMNLSQALNLRKQTLVTQTAFSNQKLLKLSKQLSITFSSGTNILDLSTQVNQPPVSVIRAILDYRIRQVFPENLLDSEIKSIVKSIIYLELTGGHLDHHFLSKAEQRQLEIAKTGDVVSYDDPSNKAQSEAATAWEQSLYSYLDEHKVNYVTEVELREAGASSTPDCLLLDHCTINGQPVRWIDCKNFYGTSSSKHFLKAARKQILKYESIFNEPGAIVYSLGFSESLQAGFPDTLLLDRGPLLHERKESPE